MSFLLKTMPFLYDDVEVGTVDKCRECLAQAQNANDDMRAALTNRLAKILPHLSAGEQIELYDLTIDAIRTLARDQVTEVRIALAEALKDVAKTPSDIARQLAGDVERAVAEPILRHSLSLSDQDLLELISQHPMDWHPVTIAQRQRLTAQLADVIAQTNNTEACHALLQNDGAIISNTIKNYFGKKSEYSADLKLRDTFKRRMRRQWLHVTDPILHSFLHRDMALDSQETTEILDKVHQRMTPEQAALPGSVSDWDADEISRSLRAGHTQSVIDALAKRGKMTSVQVQRMLDAKNGKAVIALCMKTNMPMSFATIAQTKLARLPPDKILYPRNGDECPLTDEDLRWQWEFFGV